MRIIFICCFLISTSLQGGAQPHQQYFVGTIDSQYTAMRDGKPDTFPIEKDRVFYDKNHIVTRVIKGLNLDIIGNCDIDLNNETGAAFLINHDEKFLKRFYSVPEKVNALHFEKVGEDEILGYPCDIYEIQYLHSMDYAMPPINFGPDTLTTTYYCAKNLRILNAEGFAKLQGNHNTKLLDGRFPGIPLKIIQSSSKGTVLTIEATKVEEKAIDEVAELPSYPVRQ